MPTKSKWLRHISEITWCSNRHAIGLSGSYGLDERRLTLQHCDLGRPANQVLCLRGNETARGMPLALHKSSPPKSIRHSLLCICTNKFMVGCLFTYRNIPNTCWGIARHAYYSEHKWSFRKQSVDITANPIEMRGLRIVYLGYSPYPLTHHPEFQRSHHHFL